LPELAINNRLCQEFLVTVVEDELEDQPVKGFRDIFFVISGSGFVEPMSVNNEDGGKAAEQG